MILTENQKLEEFIKLRNRYINLLSSGKISKIEFNRLNNQIFDKINLRPFSVLDSFNKALYNYNFYNSLAKINLEKANKYKRLKDSKSVKTAKEAENRKLNNYFHKDQAILSMIELEEGRMDAYYIKMHSKNLSDTIFEIVFYDRENIILHTKNLEVKDLLIKKNVFLDEVRVSLIDSYINN